MEKYATQRRVKEENRAKILRLLYDKPRTFTEILNQTGFSPMGLSKMLKELKDDKKIKKDGDKKSPYHLAEGRPNIYDIVYLGNKISEIRDSGGRYYYDLSNHSDSETSNFDSPWGMESHLLVEKNLRAKKLNPFWHNEVFDIEQYIFERILHKAEKERIYLDEDIKGKIILGFEIDYQKLVKAIRNYNPKDHKSFVKDKTRELEFKTMNEKPKKPRRKV
ncbi:MAG: winged helix-turn-helix domain-containing protein [Nitrosopumilus sp.]|nr:winged helix-turn-helix domain-containing protein [Nitrosopumilus sp.]